MPSSQAQTMTPSCLARPLGRAPPDLDLPPPAQACKSAVPLLPRRDRQGRRNEPRWGRRRILISGQLRAWDSRPFFWALGCGSQTAREQWPPAARTWAAPGCHWLGVLAAA